MSRKTSQFTIKEEELAKLLERDKAELDKIIDFFDKDPNDKWDLKENDHFIYVNKTLKERIFSQQGAYAIAEYIEFSEKKTLWDVVKEFVTKHKEKIRHSFIRQKVIDNSSSLTLRNNRHFLSKQDVVGILCTSYARINKAFEDLQRTDNPMIIYEDFDDIEGKRYYSLSGLYKLSKLLSSELKNEDRRKWCKAIEVVGKQTFKLIIDAQTAEENRIKSAMSAAKRRDGSRCRITGAQRDKYNKITLASHHIYSREHYPHLAACRENIITLTQDIHSEFHNWNGGFQKACTIDDLICFINERYPDNEQICIDLHHIKAMLNVPKAS